MIDFIVFTKDRPAQYDLLIRSLMPWADIGVRVSTLYKRTSSEMHKSYELSVGSPLLCEESTFKRGLLELLSYCKYDRVCMMPDDNVMLSVPMRDQVKYLSANRCSSIRLHPKVTFCQPANKQMKVPELETLPYGYRWQLKGTDRSTCWGYPQCIENIHDRKTLIKHIEKMAVCRNSGDLEVSMGAMYADATEMVCLKQPYTVNIPWNRVLDTNNPTVKGFSVEDGMNRFLKGERLSLQSVQSHAPSNACHIEIEPVWE